MNRIAYTTTRGAGRRVSGGYFATKADADAFEAELSYLLVNQYGAFNSPVWFNCGLWHEYGIKGSGGNWAAGSVGRRGPRPAAASGDEGDIVASANANERPQCSACFIQTANDDSNT